MAYNTEDLEREALKLIEDKKLMFINEVVSLMPCRLSTFYNLFPVAKETENAEELERMEARKRIDLALEQNRVLTKINLRAKWYASSNPTTSLALYKLIATKEEQRALSMQFIDLDIPEDTEISIKIAR